LTSSDIRSKSVWIKIFSPKNSEITGAVVRVFFKPGYPQPLMYIFMTFW